MAAKLLIKHFLVFDNVCRIFSKYFFDSIFYDEISDDKYNIRLIDRYAMILRTLNKTDELYQLARDLFG